ncbi:nAD-dependent protein deacetylases SIR2 family [Acidaminococcus sp. CAG:917]|nr:nAD-dependent protein deacetylases SIR2 family [Acidaminococcus sp. CAG:917]
MSDTDKLNDFIKQSSNAVFFGGAGVSTASGIPDFRGKGGLYMGDLPAEVYLSHSFFVRNTEKFFEFYRSKMLYPNAKPNVVHSTLASLEKAGKLRAVITQNIDGLHQMAGSRNVIELHGSVNRNYCLDCGEFYGVDYILNSKGVPKCAKCGGVVKPDVVLYEEPLSDTEWSRAYMAIEEADLIIVGGTSLSVYPASSLLYNTNGKILCLINNQPTSFDSSATLVIRDDLKRVFESISI